MDRAICDGNCIIFDGENFQREATETRAGE